MDEKFVAACQMFLVPATILFAALGMATGVASDRRRARQLRPGPRIAQQSTFEYNPVVPAGTRFEID